MACVRSDPKSWWWSTSSRKIAPWSSATTVRSLLARKAAMAVDKASFGSFFCDLPEPSTRTRAARVAQRRSGYSIAHLSSRST
jgi:hypothetical protein